MPRCNTRLVTPRNLTFARHSRGPPRISLSRHSACIPSDSFVMSQREGFRALFRSRLIFESALFSPPAAQYPSRARQSNGRPMSKGRTTTVVGWRRTGLDRRRNAEWLRSGFCLAVSTVNRRSYCKGDWGGFEVARDEDTETGGARWKDEGQKQRKGEVARPPPERNAR